jgi:imidazolonepropionase-like amidohydrolase
MKRLLSKACGAVARVAPMFALLGVAALSPNAGAQAVQVLKGRGYVNADGALVKNATIILSGDSISGVGTDAPDDAPVTEFPDGVFMPGLIDLDGQLTAAGQVTETARPMEPDATAADAFDRFSPDLRRALQAGVTTIVLSADDRALVGGTSAVCRTALVAGRPSVRPAGPMKLSLSPVAFRGSYEPSSRAGALGLLRRELAATKAAAETENPSPWQMFVRGERTGFITAPFGADVLSAAELARDFDLRLIAIHSNEADLVADSTKGLVGVIVGPLSPASEPRAARAAARFAAAEVKVAICGSLPYAPADSLRIGAAVAARNGLSPELARRAISTTPAEFLGLSEEIGVLAPGRAADIVVFSGDPLDLRSRVLAVYVAGECVYRADTTPEGAQP